MEKSNGQRLIEAVEAFITSYVVFPSEHYGLVLALWVINTWFFEWSDATPYLAICAETKRAGKTTTLDLLRFLSKNPETVGAGTVAATYRLMDTHGGSCSLFSDEAEKMAGGVLGLMRQFQNFGYRVGETIPRTMPGGHVEKFPCYCPKAFALIGDVSDTLRDRSIRLVLKRAVSPKAYRPTTAAREAESLVTLIRAFVASSGIANKPIIAPDWLDNREQEIWEPLYSLVSAVGDDEMIERFQRASADMSADKGAPLRRAIADAEATADDQIDSERLLRDVADCFNEGETVLSSVALLERLHEIPTAQWRRYKGVGLSAVTLAARLRAIGVMPDRLARKRGEVQVRGYKLANVLAHVPVHEGGEV